MPCRTPEAARILTACAIAAWAPLRGRLLEVYRVAHGVAAGSGSGLVHDQKIASAVGGLPEIVADGQTGVVVPPADAEALAEAIVALAGDLPRAAEMGAAARVRALDEFTPERCVARVEALYQRALAPPA